MNRIAGILAECWVFPIAYLVGWDMKRTSPSDYKLRSFKEAQHFLYTYKTIKIHSDGKELEESIVRDLYWRSFGKLPTPFEETEIMKYRKLIWRMKLSGNDNYK